MGILTGVTMRVIVGKIYYGGKTECMTIRKYADSSIYGLLEGRYVCAGIRGEQTGGRGARNVSRVCHIPARCRMLCLFTPFTGGNEVRGDGCSSLLLMLQQREEG